MKTRTYRILIAVLATSLIVSTATATALYTMTIPATVTIDSSAWTLYSNSACTTPITSISFGSVAAGGNSSVVLCIKNTGPYDQYLTSNSVTSTLPASVGSVAVTSLGTFSLPLEFRSGNTAPITLTLTALPTAPIATDSFDISIAAFSSSTG